MRSTGTAVFGRHIFQTNDMKRIQVHCVAATVGDNYSALREENKIRMRHRIFVATRCNDGKRTKSRRKASTNMIHIHDSRFGTRLQSVKS
jgi:hypothetical protein